jgi:hypothetical protein
MWEQARAWTGGLKPLLTQGHVPCITDSSKTFLLSMTTCWECLPSFSGRVHTSIMQLLTGETGISTHDYPTYATPCHRKSPHVWLRSRQVASKPSGMWSSDISLGRWGPPEVTIIYWARFLYEAHQALCTPHIHQSLQCSMIWVSNPFIAGNPEL